MAYPRAPYASLSRVGCTFSELSRRDASMDRSRLGVAALTGAVFGNLVGYLAYKLNDSLGITFLQWLTNPNLSGPGNAALFAIMGAILGGRFSLFIRPAFTVNMTHARGQACDDLPVMIMSALGHKRTFAVQNSMSALPPKADMCSALARCPLCAKSGHRAPITRQRPTRWDRRPCTLDRPAERFGIRPRFCHLMTQ